MKQNALLAELDTTKKVKVKVEKTFTTTISQQILYSMMFVLALFLFNFLLVKINMLANLNIMLIADVLFLLFFHHGTKMLTTQETRKTPSATEEIGLNVVEGQTPMSMSNGLFDMNFDVEETVQLAKEEETKVELWTTFDIFRIFFIFPLIFVSLIFVVFLLCLNMIDNIEIATAPLLLITKGMFFCLLLVLSSTKIFPYISTKLSDAEDKQKK